MEEQSPTQPPIPEFCVYCSEPAELMCGKCESVFYCKPDHQKLDWRRHSQSCTSLEENRLRHLNYIRKRRNQIFEKIARGQAVSCIKIANKLIEEQQTFIKKYPKLDIQLQIEYGCSFCLMIRLLIASKEFSTAQDVLSDYFKQKLNFLDNSDNIMSKDELTHMKSEDREKILQLISGKLRLISTLANLTHQLIRNSIDMLQILITHFEKVYGHESLELSNVYFYTANYLKFLNMQTKALACFLKAAKLRKQKGGTAYYNVALLLLDFNRKRKALQFFHKALELIQKQNNKDNNYIIPLIYQNIALIYLNGGMLRLMIDYFQRAYFYYVKHEMKDKAQIIMNMFLLIKQEAKEDGSEDIKMIEFNKERKEKRPIGTISSKNREKYRDADKVAEQDQRKTLNWLHSFREIKLNKKDMTPLKPPKELEYLFGNELNKHEEQDNSLNISEKYRHVMADGINMDLSYMKILTSNQVGYLHELNRLLIDCKDSAAYFDIVQNSNFYQAVNRDKLNGFYRLNPRLVRPTDLDRRLMLQVTNEADMEDEQDEYEYVEPNILSQQPKTPKLDLSKLKPNQF